MKRAEGHLRSIIDMISDERNCVDIAQQLYAVEKALAQAKNNLIHDHIDHCLEHTISGKNGSTKEALAEFKLITRYL